ncbi:type II toxin-antitoxin system HicB family antitoxin [Streptococcus pneumoniae]|uniref:type II toxin-antitoxin system HicB family antitoxin n=1 Tax=Streptococcus pneumoniae TaxID=1313 RepID=UPI000765472E|nr:type II toxin-antitoxin system HicB family antitoxin [Streptococcus pneumoniae]MDA2873661.1 type II toxin-antitoxin system HicB family antitoxin [Streptococcus pneumoniae]MDA2876702.1 type II toxin-antitoxin system HicB family antitoxin [Streptococcus pneumoniae]MDD0791406.1 type II toxin-antitoxin system HicB family antitoxin [Streptococcus pneumoniae]MDD0795944.1 type II toxin-antitoxin system HicB family antitoxin [Streptococcus pneumoniae]CVW30643.1 phage-like protein [Streptococcus pne
MLVTYPALFYYDDTDGTEATYFVHFPDFEYSATQGEGISEALAMGSEWLGITVADLIESDEDFVSTYDLDKSFISMVSVDVSEYLGSQEPIKKTLTIPKWADKLGREMGLNFSQTLTDAIADKKVQA